MESTPQNGNVPQTVEAPNGDASHTAKEYIDEQLALEADAKEILPFKFDKCSNPLGPLRQSLFACLTCNPPPASPAQVSTPAGICYACSISCHGDHNLVELFTRRNFVCDCGTTRMPSTSPCTLRMDPKTDAKGVSSQEAAKTNTYNQNFRNRFCGCEQEYDAETEKGTMYQCLGLGTVETGGCGEDWWHPHCLLNLPSDWPEQHAPKSTENEGDVPTAGAVYEDDAPVPDGFPTDEDFSSVICYKCVEANPWIKPYAGTDGFLPPVYFKRPKLAELSAQPVEEAGLKRKAPNDEEGNEANKSSKRFKEEIRESSVPPVSTTASNEGDMNPKHKHELLGPPLDGVFSILTRKDFREHLCHCPQCFPSLVPHPQLQEEEDEYEPSLSDSQRSLIDGGSGARSHGTGSLLERGEAALSTMDRVKAIEGVMVYNHLKDKVKDFLKPYAESGQAVTAEDIKAYFEKLRGDEAAIKAAGDRPEVNGNDDDDQSRRHEQSGY